MIIGSKWQRIRDLQEGGQAHTFVVKNVEEPTENEFVLKRLKNLKRGDRFDREIRAVKLLVHPNILPIVDTGVDEKGRAFLVSEYCKGGSLEHLNLDTIPDLEKFRLFYKVCEAVEFAHTRKVYHRDLKPSNVFLRDSATPVLGDFGICLIEDDGEITNTTEVMGSRFYCAPELRDGRAQPDIPHALADVYSLGKLLHWLFSHEIFDGHEETYNNHSLASGIADCDSYVIQFEKIAAAALVDDLVSESVVRVPNSRKIRSASQFKAKVAHAIDRTLALGRVLNLTLPKRCLFCGEGQYRPLHEIAPPQGLWGALFPTIDHRINPPARQLYPNHNHDQYGGLRAVACQFLGSEHGHGIPLYLVCTYCGNVQFFRLDMTGDKRGEMWKP